MSVFSFDNYILELGLLYMYVAQKQAGSGFRTKTRSEKTPEFTRIRIRNSGFEIMSALTGSGAVALRFCNAAAHSVRK